MAILTQMFLIKTCFMDSEHNFVLYACFFILEKDKKKKIMSLSAEEVKYENWSYFFTTRMLSPVAASLPSSSPYLQFYVF